VQEKPAVVEQKPSPTADKPAVAQDKPVPATHATDAKPVIAKPAIAKPAIVEQKPAAKPEVVQDKPAHAKPDVAEEKPPAKQRHGKPARTAKSGSIQKRMVRRANDRTMVMSCRHFRSYNAQSGTYLGYDRQIHSCQ
jgi:hypothetical protein